MTQRGKAINVKIATVKVIKALEVALAKLEADYKASEASEAKYEKAKVVWQKDLLKFAVAKVAKAQNLRTNYRSYSGTLNVDFDIVVSETEIPIEPSRDYVQVYAHSYNEQKDEISNAIRILKMTDEEVVSTSTYNAIARYL